MLDVAGDLGHGHDEKVPEGVAFERAVLEAVVEELLNQRPGVGNRHQALADITGRQDPVLVPQSAARPAVVGDGHDRVEVARELLQPTQQRAQPVAAADADDARTTAADAARVEKLGDTAVAARDEWAQDRALEHVETEDQEADTQPAEEERPDGSGQELARAVIRQDARAAGDP